MNDKAHFFFEIIYEPLSIAALLWIMADFASVFFLGKPDKRKILRMQCAVMKPFALPGALLTSANILFDLSGNWDEPMWVRLIFSLMWLNIARTIYRSHDDDDFWKKKRKKLASKVKQVAGRLIVVPVPAPTN